MRTKQFGQMALTTLLLAACVAFSGACIVIEHAYAQGANSAGHAQSTSPAPSGPPAPVPASPPPILNSSSPNTVTQQPETPVSPSTPGTLPGSTVR